MTDRLLFLGATGNLGAPVARQMIQSGLTVRALVRDPDKAAAEQRLAGVELVRGDARDRSAVQSALSGCDAAYSSLSSDSFELEKSVEYIGMRNLCELGRNGGLRWLGYISGAGDLQRATGLRPLAIKAACEQLVQNSGVPWTVFKPSHFYESLPMFVRDGRISIPGRQPHRYHYLACADYACQVVAALTEPTVHNRQLNLLGPEALTMAEALAVYRDAQYPGQHIGQLPLWLMRLMGRVSGNAALQRAAELFAAFAAYGDDGARTELPVGFPRLKTTCEQWCAAQTVAGPGSRRRQ